MDVGCGFNVTAIDDDCRNGVFAALMVGNDENAMRVEEEEEYYLLHVQRCCCNFGCGNL